jgi:hypothetical protein
MCCWSSWWLCCSLDVLLWLPWPAATGWTPQPLPLRLLAFQPLHLPVLQQPRNSQPVVACYVLASGNAVCCLPCHSLP